MMSFFRKFKKKEKGSLTVEATIVLPIVIVSLLFIINIINIYMVNACMQQALNNTGKTISHYSYLVYRIYDDVYSDFLKNLSKQEKGVGALAGKTLKEIDTYVVQKRSEPDEVDEKIKKDVRDIKKSINVATTSVASVSNAFKGIWTAFDNYDLFEKEPGLGKRLDKFKESTLKTGEGLVNTLQSSFDLADKLVNFPANEAKNLRSLFWSILSNNVAGGVTDYIITNTYIDYVKMLNVPASRIKDLDAAQTQLNSDGSITMAVSYTYVNPFSFVNNNNLGFSPLNKEIKMFQSITIRPFVGKNGTSLPKKKASGTTVWVSENGKKCYHSRKDCSGLNNNSATETNLINVRYEYSACQICCYLNGDAKASPSEAKSK